MTSEINVLREEIRAKRNDDGKRCDSTMLKAFLISPKYERAIRKKLKEEDLALCRINKAIFSLSDEDAERLLRAALANVKQRDDSNLSNITM